MKKIFTNILTLAALLITGVAFTACSSSDDSIVEQQPANPGEQVYTLTIKASKDGSATTRALKLETSGALTAYWANGDELTVYNETKGAALTGTLTASNASGSTATFSGTLSGTIAANDVLTLTYHPIASISSYEGQDGTLSGTNGAEKYDMATATVTVASVNSGDITTTGNASFTTQTAMIKFTLQDDAATPAMLNATSLKVSIDGEDILTFSPTATTYSANGNGILYFALPNADVVAAAKSTTTTALASAKVSFSATVGSDTYKITKTGYPFAAGKYYTSTLTTRKLMTYDLGAITGNLTLNDGDTATGKLTGNYKISIADGATVTLNGVTIDGTKISSFSWPGITCLGNANIILVGTNTVITTADGKPAILASGDTWNPKTLTISGSGSLTATGGPKAAGIGSGASGTCGDITISGGTVEAYGGSDGAGIGSGASGTCGDITISGGTITANGGSQGAGIGSGYYQATCGNIKISGGTVTAMGGGEAAGIGSGYYSGSTSSCGDITITNTVAQVTAIKGSNAPNSIGKGYNSAPIGTITFGSTQVYNGSVWSPNPMAAGTYGGLTLDISTKNETNDTWKLTPTP